MRVPSLRLTDEVEPIDEEFRVVCMCAARRAKMQVAQLIHGVDAMGSIFGDVEVDAVIARSFGTVDDDVRGELQWLGMLVFGSCAGPGVIRTIVLGATDAQTVRVGLVVARGGLSYLRVGVGMELAGNVWQAVEVGSALVEAKQ